MEWVRDYAVLRHHEEKYKLYLGLVIAVVNKNEDGKYYYRIYGAIQRTSKHTYATADEAKNDATASVRYQLGNMLAKLNSMEAPPVAEPAER